MDDGGSPKTGFLVGLVKKILKPATGEELISMVNEVHEQGVIEATEAEMIHKIFEFGDKKAQDVMVHRKHIEAVDASWKLDEALRFMLETNHSRFPVYEDNIDNVIGFLHTKDVMRAVALDHYGDWFVKDVPNLLRKAIFVPETRNVGVMFQNMRSKKIRMVLVIDEYGQIAGIVTMEDILEEIVGNIQDEYDEEEAMIEKVGENCYIMNGLTPIEEVEEVLGEELVNEAEVETLNGFIVMKLDKIPEPDEHAIVMEKNFSFEILSMNGKMIEKIRVTILEKKEEPEKNKNEKRSNRFANKQDKEEIKE